MIEIPLERCYCYISLYQDVYLNASFQKGIVTIARNSCTKVLKMSSIPARNSCTKILLVVPLWPFLIWSEGPSPARGREGPKDPREKEVKTVDMRLEEGFICR